HLRGLSLLLQNHSGMRDKHPSTTTMLIWRSGIRMDHFLSSMYPCKPIFPPPPREQEDFHRTWIHGSVRSIDAGEDWAMAQFALDNLQLRAAHLSWRASQLRSANSNEVEI